MTQAANYDKLRPIIIRKEKLVLRPIFAALLFFLSPTVAQQRPITVAAHAPRS